jgi:TolA-binding protein
MRLIPALLLAVPFTWSSLRAEEKSNDQKISDLQREVSELRRDIAQLRKDLLDNATQRNADTEELRRIRTAVERMAREQETISRYGPPALPPGAPPLQPTGTITVQNNYSAPATVRINGRPYVVAPGQSMPIHGVPTGTFQYSVDVDGFGMVELPRTDNLPSAGYRISIFPRPY